MDTAVASHTAPLAPTAVYTGETGTAIKTGFAPDRMFASDSV